MKTKMLRKAKLSRRYLWSFLIVVLVIDLIITILLFTLYSGIQISKATDYSVAQLDQVCTSTDILYESLEAVANQIVSDSDTFSFLLSQKMNRLQETRASYKLKAIRTANPYLRYITMYNGTSKRYLSNATAGDSSEIDVSLLYEQLGTRPYACFVRQVGSAYSTQPSPAVDVYTFVFRMNLKSDGSTDLVIVDVNESYFNKALSNIRVEDTSQEIIMVDNAGNIISEMTASPKQGYFTATSERMDVNVAQIYKNYSSSGSLSRQDQDGTLRFVTYAKARTAGWTILNVLPYNTVLSGIGSLAALTLTMMLVTLAFGYMISRKVSSQLYAPIRVLYDNYASRESQGEHGNELELLNEAFSEMYSKADRLEQGLISSFNESKNMYLRYLLGGEESKVRSALPTYERLEIDLSSPFYTTIILECVPQVSDDQNDREQREANLFISYYALENITRELISASCRMEFLRTDENRFTLLLYLTEEELSESLREGLQTITRVMAKEFHMDATLCVGNVVDSWTNINFCYEQTQISLNSRSSSHYGQVFFSGDTPEALSRELYYTGMHTKLAEHIRVEDMDACEAEFNLALTAMQNISYKTAKTYFRHVLMSVLDDFSVSFEKEDSYFIRLMERLDEVDGCQNVRALKTVVLGFLSDLSHRLALNRKNSNQDAAVQAQNFIDRNFSNPDLSLRMLADLVNLSPAYLGKVFTTVTTFTFNDYLNNIRTAKAAELLRDTKLPVSKISEEVGILNTNYFYAVFKKRYGTTPTSFRKEAKPSEE